MCTLGNRARNRYIQAALDYSTNIDVGFLNCCLERHGRHDGKAGPAALPNDALRRVAGYADPVSGRDARLTYRQWAEH